jgi:hypothetical protein
MRRGSGRAAAFVVAVIVAGTWLNRKTGNKVPFGG